MGKLDDSLMCKITTGNMYDMYYGYVLNEEESDEFCFSNY